MKTLSCPQCGASLQSGPISGLTVECPYCHSTVIVPPELRPPPVPSFALSPPPLPVDGAKAMRNAMLAIACGIIALPIIFMLFSHKKPQPGKFRRRVDAAVGVEVVHEIPWRAG
ncbi:MAG: hypothetical protein LC754_07185 [Acidobacteria bacterium]|nr:hypothetical protein [Acidobacteriota bacterium]